jgi:hypothetical protein
VKRPQSPQRRIRERAGPGGVPERLGLGSGAGRSKRGPAAISRGSERGDGHAADLARRLSRLRRSTLLAVLLVLL